MSKINPTFILGRSEVDCSEEFLLKKIPTLYRFAENHLKALTTKMHVTAQRIGTVEILTLIYISKNSSSVRKWYQSFLLKTKYKMASHFIDIENSFR